jgi:glycogen operon protein
MLLGGDEFGRSQQGNNNAYCQDNEISWTDWTLQEANAAQIDFVRRLTDLRHRYPILRRSRFLTGAYDEELGVQDVTWIKPAGEAMRDEDWADGNARCFGMLMDGRAQPTGIRQRGTDATLLLVANSHHEGCRFTLPSSAAGVAWALLIDTNIDPDGSASATVAIGDGYDVAARSLLLFVLQTENPTIADGAG